VSDLLRSVMVECAEMARAGRTPAPFHGCAQVGGGGAAMGIVQPPIALADVPVAGTAPTFSGPVIVYSRDTDAVAAADRPAGERRAQRKQHHDLPVRRVA
jgi:hypothetical protein